MADLQPRPNNGHIAFANEPHPAKDNLYPTLTIVCTDKAGGIYEIRDSKTAAVRYTIINTHGFCVKTQTDVCRGKQGAADQLGKEAFAHLRGGKVVFAGGKSMKVGKFLKSSGISIKTYTLMYGQAGYTLVANKASKGFTVYSNDEQHPANRIATIYKDSIVIERPRGDTPNNPLVHLGTASPNLDFVVAALCAIQFA